MGDARKKAAKKERGLQVANVSMTFAERALLRRYVGQAPVRTPDEAARSARAIEALESDEPELFNEPTEIRGDVEARKAWRNAFQERCAKDEEEIIGLTIENASQIVEALKRAMQTGQVSGDGAFAFRRVLRRVSALAQGEDSEGVAAQGVD